MGGFVGYKETQLVRRIVQFSLFKDIWLQSNIRICSSVT